MITPEHRRKLILGSLLSWTDERKVRHAKLCQDRQTGKTYEEMFGSVRAAEIKAKKKEGLQKWIEQNPSRLDRKHVGGKISESLKRAYREGRAVNNGGYRRARRGMRSDLGHTCRSSWEANVARLFLYANQPYEYERKRFVLSTGETYLIDFYLPNVDCYVEVKGYESGKTAMLLSEYPNIKIHVVKESEYIVLCLKYRAKVSNWENVDYLVSESSTTSRQAIQDIFGLKIKSDLHGNMQSVTEMFTPLENIIFQK
jgi:hypothetical protein